MQTKVDFSDKFMLAEDIPDIDLFFSEIWMKSFANNLENSVEKNYSKVLGVFEGYHLNFYYGEKDCFEFTKYLFEKIVLNPEFGDKINSEIIKRADKLEEFSFKLFNTDLSKRSNKELWNFYEKHLDLHTKLYEYCWLPNATDMFYPEYTNYLKNYLRTKTNNEEQVNKHFVILTNPSKESVENIQTKKFLQIAIKLKKDNETFNLFKEDLETIKAKIKPEFFKLVERHWNNYKHLNRLWVGEPANSDYYFKQFKDVLISAKNLDDDLKSKKVEKEKLLKELKIDSKTAKLFEVFGSFMLSKLYRRYAQLRTLYHIDKLQKEICKRFGLSLKQARFVLPNEMKELLLSGKIDSIELNNRSKFCVYYTSKDFETIFTGEKAKQIAEKVQKIDAKDIKEFSGQCACPGYAKGRVKIIIRANEMSKMNSGDILVSIATDPDIVPAMKKAGAIVTEQGGVTSHAAIVSRELGIPCVIGTKIATRALKDNDLVEVDATKGIIKILEK